MLRSNGERECPCELVFPITLEAKLNQLLPNVEQKLQSIALGVDCNEGAVMTLTQKAAQRASGTDSCAKQL